MSVTDERLLGEIAAGQAYFRETLVRIERKQDETLEAQSLVAQKVAVLSSEIADHDVRFQRLHEKVDDCKDSGMSGKAVAGAVTAGGGAVAAFVAWMKGSSA